MKRTRVSSSNVYSIGHSSDPGNEDEPGNTLEVEYNGDAVWRYSPISNQRHAALMSSPSKGKYLNEHIKFGAGVKAVRV